MVMTNIGDGPHLSILIFLAGVPVLRLLGDIVDPVSLVRLDIGVGHWSIVTVARVTFFLHIALLLAISADDIGVPGAVGMGLVVVAGGSTLAVPLVASPNCGHLHDLLLGEVLPGNGFGLLQVEVGLNSCNFLGVFVSSNFQALGKVVFPGLQNFVANVVADTSKEQLVLK